MKKQTRLSGLNDGPISQIYGGSLSLLTDLYQLTMCYGYWKSGKAEQEAVFNMFFRKNPFSGGFAVACGLKYFIDYVSDYHLDRSDLDYLSELKGNDGNPLFEEGFLKYLEGLRFDCDIDAVPEGTVVFPHEPLVRVRGPITLCQLLESPLLNIVNHQTLIATKAARIKHAAGKDDSVLEFGLRRAQGIDGSLAASWAAYIGGCDSTSNVLAGKIFDIPVKGTQAHSWIMSFDDELESFMAYAKAMPNNSVFLVDTYDTIEGVKKAIKAGHWLKEQGHSFIGIRLDSGDLAYLSREARKLLDESGFYEAKILASNDLDEHLIHSLKEQGAKIDVWGVGTKLTTAYDQPALGGVYKLAAIRKKGSSDWNYKVKLSEQAIKVSTPGILQIRRFIGDGEYLGDMIFDQLSYAPNDRAVMIDPMDMTKRKSFSADRTYKDLLVPIFRQGKCIYDIPSARASRNSCQEDLKFFHEGIKRLLNPHRYAVGLEKNLYQLKTDLILKARGFHS